MKRAPALLCALLMMSSTDCDDGGRRDAFDAADEEYFAYVEMNVNWWSPRRLYNYDREADRPVEHYT